MKKKGRNAKNGNEGKNEKKETEKERDKIKMEEGRKHERIKYMEVKQ